MTNSPASDDGVLFTDLYELTMLQAYVAQEMEDQATFSLFVRSLPSRRNYLVACGLETVLDYLETVRFQPADLEYLASLKRFSDSFLRWLEGFRFSGSVRAVAEGTPMFAGEPILEISAPIAEAQFVETFVMNQIHLQTLLASKAARVVTAAGGRMVADFGARRIHGTDAAIKGARAFWIAGVAATSNVAAGRRYGLPVTGTMAHSYVQAARDEGEAFHTFARHFPETVLLVDTYDTLGGVRRVVDLAQELGAEFRVVAIRLDSGDLAALATDARALLDDAGLEKVRIVASGGLDEDSVAGLVASGAPIDGFGVGTAMGVSDDVASLDIAYKLVEYAGLARMKLSSGKRLLPGPKQVFRLEENGHAVRDILARAGEDLPGRPLLEPVMVDGRRPPGATPPLAEARARFQRELALLPARVASLTPARPGYPVEVSPALEALGDEIAARVTR